MNQGRDPIVVVLLLAIIYLLLREDREQTPAPTEISPKLYESELSASCPFCDFTSHAFGEANVARSIAAHMQQAHPLEWERRTGRVRSDRRAQSRRLTEGY